MRVSRMIMGIVCGAVILGGVYGTYRVVHPSREVPAGIGGGNGRIEANEVDLSAKHAGRVAEIRFQEGDMVQVGDVVARIDTADLEASLRSAEARVRQAGMTQAEAAAVIEQRKGELVLAEREFERAATLLSKGTVSEQRVDQARSQRRTAASALEAACNRLEAAKEAASAARAEVERQTHLVADGVLRAPCTGRVLYRLAEPGEVLAAGGKVATLIDLSNIYMTLFLPTAEAGRIALGAEARIILDVMPDRAVPAKVSFVSPRAQFTPRQVETQRERDRMMYRVKIRVPEQLVRQHIEQVKTGLTGMGYVRLAPDAAWPDWLESDLTKAIATGQ